MRPVNRSLVGACADTHGFEGATSDDCATVNVSDTGSDTTQGSSSVKLGTPACRTRLS